MGPRQKAWIEALKSDRFKQGQKALCLGARFCCLGVACEVALELGLTLDKGENGGYTYYGKCKQTAYLPDEVVRFFGFRNTHVEGVDVRGHMYSLTDANDRGVSFNEIAKYVETHEKLVFDKEI